jgi:hypothetical protein
MMNFTRNVATALLLGLWAVGAQAQQGLAELPPVSYQGTQYVDSAGCVYIRAGIDDAVTWVPRVTRDRKPVCGYTPTFTVGNVRPAAPDEEPVLIAGGAAPVAVAAPRQASRPTVVSPRRVDPVVVPVGLVVTPETAAANGVGPNARVVPRHVYENRRNTTNVAVPKGYRKVWQDDRLNPRRAEQSLAGHAKMRAVWSNTVPSRLLD